MTRRFGSMMYWLLSLVTLLPLTLFAQEGFVPLVGIPFLETGTPQSLGDYASAFYLAAISLGAVIAVLKIIFAGVKYMLSDIITDKQAAKQDIKGALVGLIIIIGAVLLLNTINPQITSLNALTGIQGLNVPTGGNPNGLQSDPCQLWVTSTTTGERECRARLSDTEQNNLEELLNPGSTAGELVAAITQEEQRAAVNDGTYSELLETSRAEAAAACGVSPDAVNEVIPIGFVGVSYYCPASESSNSASTAPPTQSAPAPAPTLVNNGQTIDTSITYTVNDPAFADQPAAENNGDSITIIGVLGEGRLRVRDATGREYPLGCSLISPPVPGC